MKTTGNMKRLPLAWSALLWLLELAAWILVLFWIHDLVTLWPFVV